MHHVMPLHLYKKPSDSSRQKLSKSATSPPSGNRSIDPVVGEHGEPNFIVVVRWKHQNPLALLGRGCAPGCPTTGGRIMTYVVVTRALEGLRAAAAILTMFRRLINVIQQPSPPLCPLPRLPLCCSFPLDLKIAVSMHRCTRQKCTDRPNTRRLGGEIPAHMARTMYPFFVHANTPGLFPAEIQNSLDEIHQILPLTSCSRNCPAKDTTFTVLSGDISFPRKI